MSNQKNNKYKPMSIKITIWSELTVVLGGFLVIDQTNQLARRSNVTDFLRSVALEMFLKKNGSMSDGKNPKEIISYINNV